MNPLQTPAGAEFFIIAIIAILALAVPFALAYWVYNDATQRGNDNAALWAAGVGGLTMISFFGGILAFVIYLMDRD